MSATTLVGFSLGFFSFVGFLFTFSYPEWKKTSLLDTDGPLADVVVLKGIWMRCSIPDVGLLSCDAYDTSVLGIPASLNALRAIMSICIISAFFALALAILAMDCVHAFYGSKKILVGRVSGLLMLVASLLCIGSVSYYANDVTVKYNIAMSSGIAQVIFVYGAALYVGWVASGVGFISALMIGCCQPETNNAEKSHYDYEYRPKTKRQEAVEYV